MENEKEYAEDLDITGENAPEPAAPALPDAPDGAQTGKSTSLGDEVPPRQSDSENRRFAAARRKAEHEEALRRISEQARTEAQTKWNETLRASGIVSPDTRLPIDSLEALDAYVRRRSAARQKSEEVPAAAPTVSPPYLTEAARAHIAGEMEEIRRIDPSVKEISDLQNTGAYPKIYELCKRGYSLSDAYKIANLDSIRAQTAAASRQAAMNAAAGKEHMSRTESRGAGMQSVPREIRESYLAFNPAATESEIAAHYNKYIKQ